MLQEFETKVSRQPQDQAKAFHEIHPRCHKLSPPHPWLCQKIFKKNSEFWTEPQLDPPPCVRVWPRPNV